MNTPFGPTWESLTPDDVIEFLSSPRDEAQTWDAKGTTVRHASLRKSVAGFANTVLGGYTVLGAGRNGSKGPWTVEGWEPPDEADQWITNCLRDGLDPLPPFEPRSWTLDSGKTLSIVRVWPVSVPPCITTEGYVYERVGLSTLQVKDAQALHRLFDRGESARSRAWSESRRARAAFAKTPPFDRRHPFVLSVGATSLGGDTSPLIFRESLARAVIGLLKKRPLVPRLAPIVSAQVDQDGLTISSENGFTSREGYTIDVRRSGSVTVGWSEIDVESAVSVLAASDTRLRRLWEIASEVLVMLSVVGPIHVALRLADSKRGDVDIDRWTPTEGVGDDLFASMQREANRTLGTFSWEPEPDEGEST